jgi:uncharacterized protein HemY
MDLVSFAIGVFLSVVLIGFVVVFVCLSGIYMDLNFVERTKSHLRAWRNSRK